MSLLMLCAARSRLNHGAGSVWTPASLASPPAVWLNPSGAVTDDGSGHCSQWNDSSTNGWNFGQGNSSDRPLIVASGQNSLRTLRFDGVNDFMSSTAAEGIYKGVTTGWMMMVGAKHALDGSGVTRSAMFASVGTNNNTRLALAISQASANNKPCGFARRQDADASAGVVSAPSATDTNFHIWLLTMNWSTGVGTLYEDGSQVAQTTGMTSTGSTTNTLSNSAVAIGAASSASVQNADVEIGECMFGAALPTSTEIGKLFTYENAKWAVY